MENLYKILGVEPNASEEEIKKAFRKLASDNHPDRHPGDPSKEEIFKKVNSAYQTLGDKNKRLSYDRTQNNPFINNNPFVYNQTYRRDVSDVSDIFNHIWSEQFREASKRSQRSVDPQPPAETYHRGDDITTTITLTLDESVYGCRKKVKVRSPRPSAICNHCSGSCAEPGTRKISCTICSGSGKRISFSPSGTNSSACPSCRGKGDVALNPCKSCGGQGKVIHEIDISVKVPAGITEGQQLRLAGQGSPGSPPGDLYLNIEVLKHDKYVRQGKDLHTSIQISLITAMRGGQDSYMGLDGVMNTIEIPAGSQLGSVIMVEGQGIKSQLGAPSGNLYVSIGIQIPKNLSARAKKLMEELAEEIDKS